MFGGFLEKRISWLHGRCPNWRWFLSACTVFIVREPVIVWASIGRQSQQRLSTARIEIIPKLFWSVKICPFLQWVMPEAYFSYRETSGKRIEWVSFKTMTWCR